MDAPANHSTAVFERAAILLICLLAAAHVYVFSATFPFYNIMDEQQHFDLVVRYSQADLPRTLVNACDDALPYLAIFGTQEYLWAPETLPGGKVPPPPWTQPMEEVQTRLMAKELLWKKSIINHEASQPPAYYAIAGAWWRLGGALGLHDGVLLYWLRFLNIPMIMMLVCLGWLAARTVFPENNFIAVAVPALIAFLPQKTFYAINNDSLAPLAFGLVFLLLLKFWKAEKLAPGLAAALGLAAAATFLTKTSELPLLAAAGIFFAWKIFNLARSEKLRTSVPSLVILSLCAGLPMGAWMAWCRVNFGDFTGSVLKIQFLRWAHKPFAEWFHHPLFTASGFWFFLKGNLATFWQGEMLWHHQPFASPAVDLTYVLLTLGALAFTLAALLRRPPQFTASQRAAVGFSFLCVAATFAFFALLSVKYDFQECVYPSRAHPFFVSGRLMLGMLVPFLILFACGLDQLMKRLNSAVKFFALAALLAFMLASEITIDWPIFPNEYNWFHM